MKQTAISLLKQSLSQQLQLMLDESIQQMGILGSSTFLTYVKTSFEKNVFDNLKKGATNYGITEQELKDIIHDSVKTFIKENIDFR